MINLGICLSDIPKERIVTAKNGKKYLNVTVDERRAEGKFGETHTVYLTPSKEERESKADKIYVGSGKELVFENRGHHKPTPEERYSEPDDAPLDAGDGLPF